MMPKPTEGAVETEARRWERVAEKGDLMVEEQEYWHSGKGMGGRAAAVAATRRGAQTKATELSCIRDPRKGKHVSANNQPQVTTPG